MRASADGQATGRDGGPRAASGLGAAALAAVVAVTMAAGPEAVLAADEARGPLSPPLDLPVHARWTGLPLVDWTERASQLAGRPVVLDRRLDPDATVTLACDGEPLATVLDRVAARSGATVEVLASSIRLVPPAARGRATAAERLRLAEVAAAKGDLRRRVMAREAWDWPAGATPRALVADAATTAGIEIAELDLVPHDHLRAANLPPLPLGERLDLVLAHYDLRVAWLPRPRVVAVEPAATAARPATAPPTRHARPRSGGKEVFTLRLEAPLDEALGAIAARLGLVLEIDRTSLAARGMTPREIVRAQVTDAPRDKLLDAVVGPTGLRWSITGDRLRVFAPTDSAD